MPPKSFEVGVDCSPEPMAVPDLQQEVNAPACGTTGRVRYRLLKVLSFERKNAATRPLHAPKRQRTVRLPGPAFLCLPSLVLAAGGRQEEGL